VVWMSSDMLVSIGDWETAARDGVETEFLAVQFERFGFTLSLRQARELCGKLSRLGTGEECRTQDGDRLFVDLDRTTRDTPFVIVGLMTQADYPRWFCDIPEPAAREFYAKLADRMRERNPNPPRDQREGGSGQGNAAMMARQAHTLDSP